ncbi:unnamed protein product [Peronospora destructor]|uniref:Uncharacterized protein n=1 Tax=Peronospora destructor TaxID=86335 RepID=A0AAV0T9H6_9STRA|nr:unnamed protein product [Peronospora destructor]
MFDWIWPEKSVTGDVVVITGGAMGLGRLLALRFALLGAVVVIWDMHTDLGHEVVNQIQATGGTAQFYNIDVTDRDKVYTIGHQVLDKYETVDVLINNAAIVNGRPLLESSDVMVERTMAVNATSHF